MRMRRVWLTPGAAVNRRFFGRHASRFAETSSEWHRKYCLMPMWSRILTTAGGSLMKAMVRPERVTKPRPTAQVSSDTLPSVLFLKGNPRISGNLR